MLKNYLKMAFKVFMRRKFFTFISLFGISVPLVVLMVVAALWDHTFAAHRPEDRPDCTKSLYLAHLAVRGNEVGITAFGYKLLNDTLRGLSGVERFSLHRNVVSLNSYLNGEAISCKVKFIDAEFWNIFNFHFLEGGPFSSQDVDRTNAVVVINEATRNKFFGNTSALGKTIILVESRFRVIGVVENVPTLRYTTFAELWLPLTAFPSNEYRKELLHTNPPFFGTVLVSKPQDFPDIQNEIQSRVSRIQFDEKEKIQVTATLMSYFEAVSSEILGLSKNRLALISFILMVVFLLLPTINLVNLNISRIRERSSEIGVRKAFGASSMALVNQFLVENVLITLVGGILGFCLSYPILRFITYSNWFRYADLQLNIRIFLAGMLMAIFFGILSGVYPAWKMSRLQPAETLKGRIQC